MIPPSQPRWRWLVRRALAAAGMLLLLALIWALWLGWPARERVTSRYTSLAKADVGEWSQVAGQYALTAPVTVTGASGLTVNLRVLRPASATDALVPVMVLLGGHRTGRDAVRVVGDPGQVAVVALDYPYDGPERLRGVGPILRTIPQVRRSLLDTPAAVSLALDWVVQQPWAQAERVELVGVSLGTQFAAAAGARDVRFQRVWFVQGAADSQEWLTHQLERRIHTAALRRPAAMLVWWLAHGATLEPQRWVAEISPRPVVIVGGRNDEALPPELVLQFYDWAHHPKRLEWTDTGHISPRRPETVRPLLDLILAEIE